MTGTKPKRKQRVQTYTTILRFERDQHIPVVGDVWETRTEIGNRRVRVRLVKDSVPYDHSKERGVRLMKATISRVFLDEE